MVVEVLGKYEDEDDDVMISTAVMLLLLIIIINFNNSINRINEELKLVEICFMVRVSERERKESKV